MVRIDLEMEKQRERSLHSAAQSVESLIITASDGIQQSDSKPRSYLSKGHVEEHHHIKDLDVMESNEKTISDDEFVNLEKESEKHEMTESDKSSSNIARQKLEDAIDRPNQATGNGSISSVGSGKHSFKLLEKKNHQDPASIQSAKRSGSIEESSSRKSEPRKYSITNNNVNKPETVRFSKSANSIIPPFAGSSSDSLNQISAANSGESIKENIASQSQTEWPTQEIAKKSQNEKQRVRLPSNSDEEKNAAYKSRTRGKSDAGNMKINYRKPTGRKPPSGVIDALDLEDMGMEKRAKIRKESVDTFDFGSREGFNRSPPQQKTKKAKHRGRVDPEYDDQDNNYDESGYNSDGPNFGSKHQKIRDSLDKNSQIYQTSNNSPPLIHNPMPANYQQMLMYGFRPQDQYQFQPQTYGNFMQPDFMMQQPLWKGQPNSAPWMPVLTPQNFGYQYYPPNPAAASVPTTGGAPFSPPAKVKNPRKIEPFPLPDSTDLAAPVSAILEELSDVSPSIPFKQEQPSPLETEKSIEKTVEKEAKKSVTNLIEDASTTPGVPNTSNSVIEEATPAAIPPPVTPSTSIVAPVSQLEAASTIRQNASAPPIPYIVSQEVEQQRLAIVHALGILNTDEHPRLTKITQMTARLLGRSCCVLSLVDTDKVIWKSVSPPITTVRCEPRYDSFCSWVVQDESGRGVTVLDSKIDPRCTHIRVKPGLEFYAGVPITIGSGKHKIGALSIQGPPSAQISVIDMNILHEMALWASGELETIMLQKTLQDRENYIQARDKLGELAISSKSSDKPTDMRILEKSLGLIRNALRANSVLLLKLSPDTKGFQSMLQAYSLDPVSQKTGNLLVGEEMFHELCAMTLKKEGGESPLLLENLKTGPVTKEVDQYLSKKITKCMSELIWSSSGPVAVLAIFFDNTYRLISKEDLSFITSIIPTLSSIFDNLELKDSFQQISIFSKTIGSSLKKQSVVFGKQQGLAPCVIVIEPRLEGFKGYDKIGSILQLDSPLNEPENEPGSELPSTLKTVSGPKGQAVGQVLAQKQDSCPTSGTFSSPEGRQSDAKKTLDLFPIESFEILNDFTLLMDILAEKFSLKKPKRLGLHYYLFANYGQDTGSLADAASFAHEIFFSLDTYNQNNRRKLQTHIGIHLDFLSSETAQDASALKDQLISLVNGAYQLETKADSILTSELFYHQTKTYCSYEPSSFPLVVRGQGAFSTYRLIGITQQSTTPMDPVPIKENGVNNDANLVTSIVPALPPVQTSQGPNNGTLVSGSSESKPVEGGVPALPVRSATNPNPTFPTESQKQKQKCTIL